ncbi:MAG: hypothetical protein IJL10_01405 [Synergistaceae bacterium]|nr:hypothetical protein [Synergistaceae bacterium]
MRVTILTNGPGELWGWVRPVASELRNRGHSISLWLLPCPFSSGHEREAASLLGVDKLEGPSSASVIWREAQHERTDRIIQMGGDISFGLRMSKFSKAPLTVYSYRHRKEIPGVKLLTAFPEQINLPSVTAIGDIVKDSVNMDSSNSWDWYKDDDSPRILFLPGSRPKIRSAVMKWLCELRDKINEKIPNARIRSLFPQFIPEKEIKQWQSAGLNPVRAGAGIAMKNADYAITQPGTNNFELMHCGLPGIVVAPEKFLNFMPVSGVAGLLADLPLVGSKIRKSALIRTIKKWNGYISLPNRTFKRDIFPELWGNVDSDMIAEKLKSELHDKDRLKSLHDELLSLSGEAGAASRLCDIATGTCEARYD